MIGFCQTPSLMILWAVGYTWKPFLCSIFRNNRTWKYIIRSIWNISTTQLFLSEIPKIPKVIPGPSDIAEVWQKTWPEWKETKALTEGLKYLILAKFTKTYDHVNTLSGPSQSFERSLNLWWTLKLNWV